MYTLTYKNFVITYKLSAKNVQIVDSYKIRKQDDMSSILKLIRTEAQKKGFKYKRSHSAWVTEWRAHNYMYDHKISRSQSRSVDLNENESKLKLISYNALSRLYKG